MLPRRYAALSIVALVLLGLGLVALSLPAPYNGPLLMQWGPSPDVAAPNALAGLSMLGPSLNLADALGLVLLAVAVMLIWSLALAWERRRHRR